MKVKLLAVWCSVICIWPSIYAQGMTDDPLTTTLKSSIQSCRSEHTNGVHWYSTAYESTLSSDPLCLDDSKFLLTRNCTEAGWVPEEAPDCQYKQNVRSVYDNFAKFSGYDLFVIGENAAVYRSRKKQWSKDCIRFGFTKDIMEYNKYFTMHPDYFWLPIRRPKPYFPHVWSNLGDKFGLVTEEYMDLGNEDCLVVNFSSNHVKSISCTEYYSELCLYVYVSPLLPLSCPKGFYTTRFQRNESKCFQVSQHDCGTYFRYNEAYDRILYKALQDKFDNEEDCRIEIDPFLPQMTFSMDYWMNHLQNVTYVNWSPLVNRNYNPQLPTYTYADKEGDWLLGSNYKCTVCEQNLVPRVPSLYLHFNYEEERLELIVSNPEFLWTEEQEEAHIACFTTGTDALLANVDLEDLLYTQEYSHGDLMINMSAFEVELDGDGPGEYWCEAVTHPGFDIISSNRQVVFQVRRGVVFSVTARHLCNLRCMGVYEKQVLKDVSKTFKDFLKKLDIDLDVENVRVMDVLNSTSSQETLLFHVTFSSEDLPDELEELDFGSGSDEVFLRGMNLINYVNKKLAPIINKPLLWDEEFTILGFNHTLFCVSEMPVNSDQKLIWARMNEIKVIPSLCLDENYVLNYAQCQGEFPHGVAWKEPISNKCENDRQAPPLTQTLFQLLSSRKITVQEVQQLDKTLAGDGYELNPTDIFLLGSLIGRFVNNITDLIDNQSDLMLFTRIFSQTLGITVDRAQMSQSHMNATNLMLDNFERLLQRSSVELNLLQTEEEKENGVVVFKSTNSICFIIDPSVKNITGIAFYLSVSGEEFESGRIEYLTADQNETELLEDDDLEGAAFLPMHLLELIRSNFTGPLRLVLTIIENDILFRSRDNASEYSPAGRVVTASIPNYERPLPGFFPIIFRPRRDFVVEDGMQCGFWNFHPSNSTRISEWSNFGCDYLARSSRDTDPAYMCGCTHFTNFAFLMTGNANKNPSGPPTDSNGTIIDESMQDILISLNVITNVGCILSLIGVILIWLTALVFRSWREREGTKVLLQLSFGIGLQMMMILLVTGDATALLGNTPGSCITIGIILHYSVLVIFAWMLITAYLQYLRYVVVFGNLLPKHFFLKANIVGWFMPLLPILIICIIDPHLYIPAMDTPDPDWSQVICYPQGNALYFGVIMPVALVIVINLCVFGLVIYNITMGLQKCNNHRKNSNKIHRAQLRLTILLFFLLGLTWIFGLFVHIEFNTYIFTYLFTIFGTMQGFVLFVYFIILDPQTRKLWLSRFSCCYKKEVTSSTYNS